MSNAKRDAKLITSLHIFLITRFAFMCKVAFMKFIFRCVYLLVAVGEDSFQLYLWLRSIGLFVGMGVIEPHVNSGSRLRQCSHCPRLLHSAHGVSLRS